MKIFLDANICLDLLDTTRPTSKQSIQWYMTNKDNLDIEFYFSADFITTFYYILTEKKKYNPKVILSAIDALSDEIIPSYLIHNDFINAKNQFLENIFSDFEDLLVLNIAQRVKCDKLITNDKKLLQLKKYQNIRIQKP